MSKATPAEEDCQTQGAEEHCQNKGLEKPKNKGLEKPKNNPMHRPAKQEWKLTKEQMAVALDMAVKGTAMTKIADALCLAPIDFWRMRLQSPDFENAFQKARLEGVNMHVDSLLEIHEIHHDPQVMRIVSDNIKWRASKLNPKQYGDKLDLNVSTQVSIKSALDEARGRTKQYNKKDIFEEIEDVEYVSTDETSDVLGIDID